MARRDNNLAASMRSRRANGLDMLEMIYMRNAMYFNAKIRIFVSRPNVSVKATVTHYSYTQYRFTACDMQFDKSDTIQTFLENRKIVRDSLGRRLLAGLYLRK
jgi:hypothetical protein